MALIKNKQAVWLIGGKKAKWKFWIPHFQLKERSEREYFFQHSRFSLWWREMTFMIKNEKICRQSQLIVAGAKEKNSKSDMTGLKKPN